MSNMIIYYRFLDFVELEVFIIEYLAKTTLDKIAEDEFFRNKTGIVYIIENIINKKKYVGITGNTFVRRYGMKFKSHNEHLCRSIDKYGIGKFVAYICYAGITDYVKLQNIEKILISKYNTNQKEYGYNMTLGGEGTLGYKFTEEDYLRIHVPVIALNMDGSIFKSYKSQKEAYDELGVYITDCLKMRNKTAHGYIWIYQEEYDRMSPEEIEQRVKWSNESVTQIKKIIALDRDGNYIKEYSSIIEASRELDCSCGMLTNCCKHKVKTYRNMIFFYKTDLEELTTSEIESIIEKCNSDCRGEFAKENLSIPVVALDMETGQYINTYPSAHDAEQVINIPNANGHIIACCKGKLVSCYGYKWCYEQDYVNKTNEYYLKVGTSVNGKRAIVGLDIKTGSLVKKYLSITDALCDLNKKGGGDISLCCSGKLNYCYGYRWMYEDDYNLIKDNIMAFIENRDKQKQENHSKCRSIPVVIVLDNIVIEKESIKNISEYMYSEYGITNVRDWFKSRGVPQKYKKRVSFCGTSDEYKKCGKDLQNKCI